MNLFGACGTSWNVAKAVQRDWNGQGRTEVVLGEVLCTESLRCHFQSAASNKMAAP